MTGSPEKWPVKQRWWWWGCSICNVCTL